VKFEQADQALKDAEAQRADKQTLTELRKDRERAEKAMRQNEASVAR